MTLRAFAVLLFAAVCGLLGLAFGHRVYFLVCFALLLVFAFSLVSISAAEYCGKSESGYLLCQSQNCLCLRLRRK